MNNSAEVLKFTEDLSELLNSGIDLPRCLSSLKGTIAEELCKSVCEGNRFSVALMTCQSASFSEWYVGFVAISENCGNLEKTMKYLSETMRKQKTARDKFVAAVFYPLSISVLTLVCGLIAVFSFSSVYSNFTGEAGAEAFRNEAFNSCIVGGTFLVLIAAIFVLVLNRFMGPSPSASLFNSLAFLTENGVPIVSAIDSSMCIVDKHPSLCNALMQAKDELLCGSSITESFSSAFFDAGFSVESKLVASNLSVSETSGGSAAFSKIAEAITKKREKIQSLILSSEQPLLLCAAAVYLVIILKSTVLKAMFPEF